MLYSKTPIGYVSVPEWEEKKLTPLSDIELLDKAVEENREFCISPATYAMIEKRRLCRALQVLINPRVGFRHDSLEYENKMTGWKPEKGEPLGDPLKPLW